ncbi:hypothetical protein BH24CHL10_BH24CHL10_00750 [soil metagenome]
MQVERLDTDLKNSRDRRRGFYRPLVSDGPNALTNACWNDKYRWNFWRPITAIHQADADGNTATQADTGWAPLILNLHFRITRPATDA